MARLGAVLASLAVGWAVASAAHAHGRFPNATEIRFHPTDSDVILVQTARGLVGTRDGGTTWEWLCYETIGAETFGEDDPDMVLLEDGSAIAAGGFSGTTQVTSSWCDSTMSQPDPMSSHFIIDVERDPSDANAAYALTSSSQTTNRVFRTADGGDTWTETNMDGVASMLLESLAVAPSPTNPDVIYITAVTPSSVSPRMVSVYRSSDGGASWAEVNSITLNEGERRPFLAGVDPTDADRVFLWIRRDTSLDNPPPDRLLLSTNGGQDFTEVQQVGSIGGFAISDDGSQVWVGDDQDGGLWHSSNGGESFSSVNAGVQINCLGWHDGQLFSCANTATDGYAIGTSTDSGASFSPFLDFSDISGMMGCPDGSAGATVCEATRCDAFAELQVDLQSVAPECIEDAGMGDAGSGMGDAGTGGAGGSGGCGVAAPTSAPAGRVLAFLTLVGLALRLRRRERC